MASFSTTRKTDDGSAAISFTSPEDAEGDSIHIELQVSTTPDFSNLVIDKYTGNSVDGWEVFTGTQFESFPSSGLSSTYQGNRVSYQVGSGVLKHSRMYYIRIRAYDGSAWSDYRAETVTW